MLKQTDDKVEMITKAPQSGVWKLGDDGSVEFVRQALNITSVADENEAFYLQVYGAGDYCYHGADLGSILARGRMQTDKRNLTKRAKLWNAGIKAQFETIPLPPSQTLRVPTDMSDGKWF